MTDIDWDCCLKCKRYDWFSNWCWNTLKSVGHNWQNVCEDYKELKE